VSTKKAKNVRHRVIGYAVDNGRKVRASGTERWNEALHHARNAILPETPPIRTCARETPRSESVVSTEVARALPRA
jgi:hypothetical protein